MCLSVIDDGERSSTMADIVLSQRSQNHHQQQQQQQQLNPATLKFTAVKVDVSALTKLCKCKAFVISSQTTARELSEMVLRKLKIDVKDHVTGTCLIGQPTDGGDKRILTKDEKVLGLLGNRQKKTLTLELVPIETVDFGYHQPSFTPNSQDDVDCIKAGNLSDSTKNGMTLPGYHKTDANSNHAIGSGFVTSTPNPDSYDSIASTVDSGFIIHYEPCSDNVDGNKGARLRSKSFEIARDNGNRLLDDSSGNASDSGMVLNGHGQSGMTNGDKPQDNNSLQHYPYRPNLQDGFQILQSQNSAWTPFSRHTSEGFIKSLSHQALPTASSVPDVSEGAGNNSMPKMTRRRSLPKLSLSQEQLEEKKRSVTDLFALKLKDYIQKAHAAKHGKDSLGARRRYNVPHRRSMNRDDDAMSVTSEEVAEIMSCASPMKPYEEDEEEESSGESAPEEGASGGAPVTPHNVFHPVKEPPDSPLTIPKQSYRSPDSDLRHGHRNKVPLNKNTLGEFVEESMKHFITSTTPVHEDQHHHHHKHHQHHRDSKPSSKTHSDRHKHPKAPKDSVAKDSVRGVPLFTLLTTHILAPVMVRRNREMAPNKAIGIKLCDVTYAKSIRHVIRHWATNSRLFTVDPTLSERMLVAIGGLDRRTTVILAGKLFRGDIIVEINGKPALELSARDVISHMVPAEVVSLVVARSRLNVERAQSP